MAIRLSNFPKGLLSLLGAQNFGVNVKEFADSIVGTVELADLLGTSLQLIQSGVFNPIANGNNLPTAANQPNLIVPTGETWKVFAIHSTCVAAAGEAATFAPTVNIGAATLYLAPPVAVAASSTRWNPATGLAGPIYVPSGGRFGIAADAVTGVPIGGITVLAQRLAA